MEALVRLKRNMLTNNVMSLYTALRSYAHIFDYTSNHPLLGVAEHPYIVLSCANTTSTMVDSVLVTYISVIEAKGNDKYCMVNACPRIGPHAPSHVSVGTISTAYTTHPFIGSSFHDVYRKVFTYTDTITYAY